MELIGTLDVQTFPGSPNYDSIKDGDEIETHFYLKLGTPVDVLPTGKHPGVQDPEEERDVTIVQLAIDAENEALWTRLRRIGKGGRVKATGTLLHRFTGHHHSRVLLDVIGLEPSTL